MKLSVIGSNTITDEKLIDSVLTKWKLNTTSSVLGGGGKGVASLVKQWCLSNKINHIEFLPYFLLDNTVDFSNKYFFIRNKQLVDNADSVLFIYNGDCKDVEYAIKYCQKLHKDYTVIKIPK